jgi:hypothetical protein
LEVSEMVRDVDPFLQDPVLPRRLANSVVFVLALLGDIAIAGIALCAGVMLAAWLSG